MCVCVCARARPCVRVCVCVRLCVRASGSILTEPWQWFEEWPLSVLTSGPAGPTSVSTEDVYNAEVKHSSCVVIDIK